MVSFIANVSITPYLCNESRFEIGWMVDGQEITMLKISSYKTAMRRSLQSQQKTEDKTYNMKRNRYTIIRTGMGLAYASSDDVIVLRFWESYKIACISQTERFQYSNWQFLAKFFQLCSLGLPKTSQCCNSPLFPGDLKISHDTFNTPQRLNLYFAQHLLYVSPRVMG